MVVGNEGRHLKLRSLLSHLHLGLFAAGFVEWDFNSIDLGKQAAESSYHILVHLYLRIEFNRCWWSLGQGPEGSALLGLLVQWIHMQKLLNIVEEVFLEAESGHP